MQKRDCSLDLRAFTDVSRDAVLAGVVLWQRTDDELEYTDILDSLLEAVLDFEPARARNAITELTIQGLISVRVAEVVNGCTVHTVSWHARAINVEVPA